MRVLIVCLVALAGCVAPGFAPVSGTSDFTYTYGQSMAPDHTGQGPSYPVLLLHTHHDLSRKQAEEQRHVVCFVDGVEIPDVELRDMAACEPDRFDQATGRVYMDNRTEWGGPAVALTPGCGGRIQVFPEGGAITVRTAGHDFHVRFDGSDYVIDGEHRVAPGQVLKVDYWMDRGDPENERMVKAVFDNPGRWLYSMIGDPYATLEERPGARPEMGDGLMAFVDAHATTFDAILGPLVEATPGAGEVDNFRIVQGAALTEVRLEIVGTDGTWSWYSAAHEDGQLRMLAKLANFEGSGVPHQDLLELGALEDLPGERGLVTSWKLAHGAVVGQPWPGPVPSLPCDHCMYRWTADLLGEPGWQHIPQGQIGTSGWGLLAETDHADGRHTTARMSW